MPLICATSEECLTHTTFSGVIQILSSGTELNKGKINQQLAQNFSSSYRPGIKCTFRTYEKFISQVDKEERNLISSRVSFCLGYVSLNDKLKRTHERAHEDRSRVNCRNLVHVRQS